eukprot:TRINITY_DN47924_c0_g1_i1.p1 TRINITY_DN47924_c0_g1~~TRINITY_DN47924_c0_g1_i1.p1  ORF type:complete len:284 (+),score=58.13 TRINITY_DN47924_c0_g1_i1:59-910(+)
MADDRIELSDDESEPQAAIVNLPPPDISEKMQAYLDYYKLPEEARDLLTSCSPFDAIRVMQQSWEGIDDTPARLRVLRSRIKRQSTCCMDYDHSQEITNFVKKYRLPDRVEFAIRSLEKAEAQEVINPRNPRHLLDGVDVSGRIGIVLSRCKYAKIDVQNATWGGKGWRGGGGGWGGGGGGKGWEGGGGGSSGYSRSTANGREPQSAADRLFGGSSQRGKRPPEDVLQPRQKRPRAGASGDARIETRIDPADGNRYSLRQFVECYGGEAEWVAAGRSAFLPAH